MSHYPANIEQARMTYDSFGSYSTRIKLNQVSVINTSTNSHTVSNFTNPAVGESVDITVTNTPGVSFNLGDHVVIGTRAGILKTPSTITTSTTCEVVRMGGYAPGANLTSFTLYISDPDNDNNVTTATTPDASFADARIGETQLFSIPVGNTGLVPANSHVSVGDHTGTYVITKVTSTTAITVKKIAAGDVPAGVSITSSPRISSGKLLAIIPRKPFLMQFTPTEFWYCCIQNDSNTSVNTPVVIAGWNPNRNSSRVAFADNMGWTGTSTSYGTPYIANGTVAGEYGLLLDVSTTSQDLRRVAVPAGHALMCATRTATSDTSKDYVIDVFVKGFFSSRPVLGSTGYLK